MPRLTPAQRYGIAIARIALRGRRGADDLDYCPVATVLCSRREHRFAAMMTSRRGECTCTPPPPSWENIEPRNHSAHFDDCPQAVR